MLNDPMADIQSSDDWRNLPVDRVGVRGIKHPIIFESLISQGQKQQQATVAHFDMLVNLPKNVKGTHMSRFLEILNERETILGIATLPEWLQQMVIRLGADNGYLTIQFPYFMKKQAPVSKASSFMDYNVRLHGTLEGGKCQVFVTIVVPVTSLCPCSKEIANYGAHNQRSHVTVTVEAKPTFSLIEVIKLVEKNASCDLYGILKRSDEKVITERAYDNPKFVEDMVRDISTGLSHMNTIKGYKISSENFESIHNHSAYAEIDRLSLPLKKQVLHYKEAKETCDI